MKLAFKLPLALGLLMALLAALVFWPLNTRLDQVEREAAQLRARLTDQEAAQQALEEELNSTRAKTTATGAARQATELLSQFVESREAGFSEGQKRDLLRGRLSAVATAALEASAGQLDTVVITDDKGLAKACAPASEDVLGKMAYEEIGLWRKRRSPRFEITSSADGQGRALVAVTPFYGGSPLALKGLVLASASFASIMRPVLEQGEGQAAPALLVIDRRGTILFAPTPDLVGQDLKESHELISLADLPDGTGTELTYNLARWAAFRRSAPLSMTIIGLVPIPSLLPPTGQVARGRVLGSPLVVIGAGAALLIGLAILMLVLVVQRVRHAAQVAQALAKGAATVELARAGAKDELGELTRALGHLGEQLADERRGREEASQNVTHLQQELDRIRQEHSEMAAFQKELESRTTREREEQETQLQTARNDLDTARMETGELRGQLAVNEQTIADKDRSISNLNEQVDQLNRDQQTLQDQVSAQAAAITEAQRELESRPKGPPGSFVLFSEASEALAVELAALLEIVQGYTSQMIESAAGAISDEQQEFLTDVINRSARSQRLLGDLRDFANIVKPEGLARDPIDIGALLQDVVSTMQPSAEDRGLELAADIPGSIPEVLGDEARLRQLFTVILQHAIRFTPEGGNVSISVLQKGGIAGIRIEDGAEAIPMSTGEVFGHFHSTGEEILETRGSGLRFPILSAIVLGHGGAIDLAINEQGGNLFFIRLPVREGAPDAAATAQLFGADGGEDAVGGPTADGGPTAEDATAGAGGPAAAAGGPAALSAVGAEETAPGPAAGGADLAALFGEPPSEGAGPDLAAAPDVSAVEGATPTTESIMEQPPAESPGESQTAEALWDVPMAEGPVGPVTLEALEGASGQEQAPEPAASPPAAAEPDKPEQQPLPERRAAEEKEQSPPASPFSFGSDEIIQE